MNLLLIGLTVFCYLGGPFWFYGLSAIFAGVGAWRYRRAMPVKAWLMGAAFCLVVAVSTNLWMVYALHDIFAGAITG